MIVKEKSTKSSWIDPDDAPELTEEVARRAQISRGGKVLRKATGTLTKRGRPPIDAESKQQVTLRLPRDVIGYFKSEGAGWQTRISDVLKGYASKHRKRA